MAPQTALLEPNKKKAVTVTLSSKSLKPVVLPSNCMPATSAPPSMLMANDNEDDHKPAAKPNFISKTPTLSPLQRCQQLLRTRNARLKGKRTIPCHSYSTSPKRRHLRITKIQIISAIQVTCRNFPQGCYTHQQFAVLLDNVKDQQLST
jgi:hypothetical protein